MKCSSNQEAKRQTPIIYLGLQSDQGNNLHLQTQPYQTIYTWQSRMGLDALVTKQTQKKQLEIKLRSVGRSMASGLVDESEIMVFTWRCYGGSRKVSGLFKTQQLFQVTAVQRDRGTKNAQDTFCIFTEISALFSSVSGIVKGILSQQKHPAYECYIVGTQQNKGALRYLSRHSSLHQGIAT